jgi:vacuolar iron transporter family protein
METRSILASLKDSLAASAGDIVFGMEDGTVSIFGLVFGVAATTTDKSTVLIAGASGAVAAAVSMMAGTYLDVETSRDEARAKSSLASLEVVRDPPAALDRVIARLSATDLGLDQSGAIAGVLRSDPAVLRAVASALEAPAPPAASQGPLEQSLWMLVADFHDDYASSMTLIVLDLRVKIDERRNGARLDDGVVNLAAGEGSNGVYGFPAGQHEELNSVAETVPG